MKHTIKIGGVRSIDIQARGNYVAISLCSSGVEAIRQEIKHMEALAVSAILKVAARYVELGRGDIGGGGNVKLERGRLIQVCAYGGEVEISLSLWGMSLERIRIDHHAAMAAADALTREAMTAQGGGVRCHGDACNMGQSPCPSPKACGVQA